MERSWLKAEWTNWRWTATALVAAGVVVGANAAPVPPPLVPPAGMVLIPGGVYRPPFRGMETTGGIPVVPFWLDVLPVTNAEFLEFVRARPRWRRAQLGGHFAEASYLAHWAGDLELGPRAPANAPVTRVSWFAARAYARWRDKRLSTTAEWEFTAASESESEAVLRQKSLRWYSTPAPETPPAVGAGPANFYGVRDLHGLIWEWVADFNRFQPGDGRPAPDALGGDVFCGGAAASAADRTDYAAFVRFGLRGSLQPQFTLQQLGFRCARDPP